MKKLLIAPATLMLCVLACCKKDDDNTSGMNNTDRMFMTNASYANYAEIDAGNTAASMGSMSSVRAYGIAMVTDHTQAQTDMKALGTQVSMTGLPTTPDSAHIKARTMLMMQSGLAFDSAYMRMQVTDHINTIALMQDEISNGGDQRVKAYANTHLPTIQMHKRMADSIVMANGFKPR